jgi:phage terminase small subunit
MPRSDTSNTDTPPLKLTAKQREFVNAYIENGFNATQAAISAGYSQSTAYSQGSRLLKNVEIKQAIDALFTDHGMGAREVIARLTEHARADLGDIYDESTGRLNWEKARAEGKTALIKKIKHTTRRTTTVSPTGTETDIEVFEDEIELHSVQTALQLIGKHHGLFVDKMEHTGANGGPIILKTGMSMDDL